MDVWCQKTGETNGTEKGMPFNVENLRQAFNQVKVPVENEYRKKGYVGLDVKAMRTTSDEDGYEHLKTASRSSRPWKRRSIATITTMPAS